MFKNPVFRAVVCLVLCAGLILGCFRVQAEAVALEATLGIGVAACLILLSAGVVFNPKTVDDIRTIGQDFQEYMYQWGTSAQKLDEVEEYFQGLAIIDPAESDDDDDWSPNKTKLKLARGLLAGISLWISSFILGTRKLSLPSDGHAPEFVSCSYTAFSNANNGAVGVYNHSGLGSVGSVPEGSFDGQTFTVSSASSLGGKLAVSTNRLMFSEGYYYLDGGNMSLFRPCPVVYGSKSFAVGIIRVDSSGTSTVINSYTQDYADFDWETDTYSFPSLSFYATPEYDYYVTIFASFKAGFYDEFMGFKLDKPLEVIPKSETGSFVVVGDIASGVSSGEIAPEDIPLQDLDYSHILPQGQSALQGIRNVVQQFYGNDMTLEKYLQLTEAADEGAAAPVITVGIPAGSQITYYQGSSPSPITVIADSPDGGTLSYEWYRYGTDSHGKVYPVEVLDTDNSFVPLTEELGTAYYYCRVINTDNSGLVNFVHTPSIRIDIVRDPNIGSEPGSGSDAEVNPDSIGQLDSETFWQKLPEAITQPIESLGTSIVEGVEKAFVPSEDFVSAKVNTLMNEFSFVTPIVTLVKAFWGDLNYSLQEPPVIYINLDDSRGSYELGGKVPFVDMRWYAEYKPIVDQLLSAFLWIVFIWRLFRQLPGIVSGMPGDFVMDGLNILHIEPGPRKAAYEVQRQSNRESIRRGRTK